jgi:hypothetical protein
MDSITITITDPRAIDGVIETVNRKNYGKPQTEWITPENYLQAEMLNHATLLADWSKIAMTTSAGFVRKFTPQEYGAIMYAAEQNSSIAELVSILLETTTVHLTDARIRPALELFVQLGILQPHRINEIVSWERPQFIEP